MIFIKKNYESKYIKSGSYVKWQSEPGENHCDECRNRNGKIYCADEISANYPVHPNCRCKLVQTVAVSSENIKDLSLLSSLQKAYILGSKKDRNKLVKTAKEYSNSDGFLPMKKGRKYYYLKAGNNGEYIIISNDGLRFVTHNNFFNIYPIENTEEEAEIRKQREETFIGTFDKEIQMFKNNEMAPMAYTYIMKNIYNWYSSESVAERIMIEAKLRDFKKTGYTKTGVEKYDKLIEDMPELPDTLKILSDSDVHYIRNELNVEFSWENFEKINERLPEKYRWEQMSIWTSLLHQFTAPLFRWNRKYVSSDGYFEAVYSYFNELLNEDSASIDMGTTNYSPSTSGDNTVEKFFSALEHFFDDMLPYYFYKNTEKDRYIRDKEVSDRIKWR